MKGKGLTDAQPEAVLRHGTSVWPKAEPAGPWGHLGWSVSSPRSGKFRTSIFTLFCLSVLVCKLESIVLFTLRGIVRIQGVNEILQGLDSTFKVIRTAFGT